LFVDAVFAAYFDEGATHHIDHREREIILEIGKDKHRKVRARIQ
jgi:hypothetical protein